MAQSMVMRLPVASKVCLHRSVFCDIASGRWTGQNGGFPPPPATPGPFDRNLNSTNGLPATKITGVYLVTQGVVTPR